MGKHEASEKQKSEFLSRLRYAIPANKFFSPRVTSSHYLFRFNLIRDVLQARGQEKKVLLFEAQGGQGKTILAAQFLNDSRHSFAWYQLGREDNDPIFFLTSILVCLKEAIPAFSSPLLEDMVVNGELNANDLSKLVNFMFVDLLKYLPSDFFMVFDDVHLLENGGSSFKLLNIFIESSPPAFRFILLSRRPVGLQSKRLRYGNDVLRLENKDIALSVEETEALMMDIFGLQLQRDVVEEVNQITDGWPMGVLMASHVLDVNNKSNPMSREEVRQCFGNQTILDFFREEVFAQIPANYRTSIMKLSFLEEVPLELAVKISGDSDIGTKLCLLADGNYFAVNCNKDAQVFGFHHLFREFLRKEAKKVFTAQEKSQIYQAAIEYSISKKLMAEALRYCLRAENYTVMEQILMADGIGFLATNRSATLLSILLAVPREIQFSNGWVALFIGLSYSEMYPDRCYEHLEQSRKIFMDSQEEMGEILALSQLIFFYWVVAASPKTGDVLLARAEEIYPRVEAKLPVFAKVVVAKNIAAGYCYFRCDMIAAHRYSSLAHDLAKKLKSKGLEASVILVQSYENFLLGRRKLNLIELENAYRLLLDPQVATIYKMALATMHVDDLQLHGDFVNYFIQQEQLFALINKEILFQTIVGSFLYVWDIGILVSQGKLRDALAEIDEGIRSGPVAETPHMLSQFLHWKAYVLAHLDEPEAALKAARKSLLLRENAGAPFYEILNLVLIGTVFGCVGMPEKAEELLTQALSKAKRYKINYLIAAGFLHRANAYSRAGKTEAAVFDIGEGLRCMRENDYQYVLGLTPEELEHVLQIAAQHNIEVEYLSIIARERLKRTFVKNGRVVPLLSVHMLGGFHLELGGQLVLSEEGMTPLQGRLLKLLLTSSNMKMEQEAIQLAFWPESPPEKARSNFDSLVSRLRKTLRSSMKQYPVGDYLVLRQGILCLQNCVLDVKKIQQAAVKGLLHAKKNEWWQAGNCFHVAASLWHGCENAEAIVDDQVHNFVWGLQLLMIKVASVWGEHLISASRFEQAFAILQMGLRLDPTDVTLLRLTYHLHCEMGDRIKAKMLLKEYEEKLVAEGLDSSELKLMISEVVA